MSNAPRNIAKAVQQLEPVFVVAPTARNGITLVQRLLNSTRKIIVYGENLYFIEQLPRFVHEMAANHAAHGAGLAKSRRRFLNGGADTWTSDLWPDSEKFALITFDAFHRAAGLYETCSREYGFARWGIKHPILTPQTIERLHILMPRARFVFLYRNLFDVVRSAKARQFITDLEGVRQYARQWRTNTASVLDAKWSHVLVVRYETLLAEADDALARIEEFTGVAGIDRAVLTRRINTFTSASAPSGYVAPQPLTVEEKDVIVAEAREALAGLGYEDGEAADASAAA